MAGRSEFGWNQRGWARRTIAVLLAVAASSLLAACIFAPGTFTSHLDVRKDRTFAFRYSGEILMIPLMESEKKAKETFEPGTCHDDETYDERPCTSDEIAQQKAEWEEGRERRKKNDAQAAQMLLGGIDPSNPESGREIAAKLRRQAGWHKVDYIGGGKFDVDFSVTGRLDRDFVFPTFEGFAMSNAFVQLTVRDDGTVRINAPGFGPANSGAGMAGMMSGMAVASASEDGPTNLANGTLTVVTDAGILANNTDGGPRASAGGQTLIWQVNPRTVAAPTALLKFAD